MKAHKKSFRILILLISIIFYSCQPNSCGNNILDGDETGIDCGGLNCPACPCGGGGTFVVPGSSFPQSANSFGLFTQHQVDSFGAFNYEIIDGSIGIGGISTDITSLEP